MPQHWCLYAKVEEWKTGGQVKETVCYYMSRLTTLWQAVGNDEGLKVKVIDEQDKMGEGKGENAKGK